jgi:hypothetical protein
MTTIAIQQNSKSYFHSFVAAVAAAIHPMFSSQLSIQMKIIHTHIQENSKGFLSKLMIFQIHVSNDNILQQLAQILFPSHSKITFEQSIAKLFVQMYHILSYEI